MITAQNNTNKTNTTLAQKLDTTNNSRTNDTGSASSVSEVITFDTDIKKNNTAANGTTFKAQITWTPDSIGKENIFSIKFLDAASGKEIKDVRYDIMLFKDGEHLTETHRSNQQAASQKYIFPQQGFYNLKIDNVGNTGASLDLPIHVVPEFPTGSVLVLIAGLLGTLIYAARSKIRR
jgi:predicted secreted protein with PEFG-CTERM motif